MPDEPIEDQSAIEEEPEDVAIGLDVLDEISQASGLDMSAEFKGRQGSFLEFELVGPDADACFGNNGRSLDGLQYLANLVAARRSEPHIRMMLDAGGYRERRVTALTELAREFAQQVVDRQEECELDPLPSNERRIVHNALQEFPGVMTYSEGEEPDRRIVIAPAK